MRHASSIRLSLAMLAALGAGTAACGPLHRGAGTPPAVLVFRNESTDQADVFAVFPGNQPIRLGTVFAGRTETLRVPPEITGRGENVNVFARLLARSTRPSSGPISIRPGDKLEVTLPLDQKMLVVLPTGR